LGCQGFLFVYAILGIGLFTNKAEYLEEVLKDDAINAGNSRSAGAGCSSLGHTVGADAQVLAPCSLPIDHVLGFLGLTFGLL